MLIKIKLTQIGLHKGNYYLELLKAVEMKSIVQDTRNTELMKTKQELTSIMNPVVPVHIN